MELQAAQKWGKTPDEWGDLPKETRAEAMAFVKVMNMIESYQMPDYGDKSK